MLIPAANLPPVYDVVDIGVKFAAGFVYTGGKLATGVVDTGGAP